jgi:hypothetical protein
MDCTCPIWRYGRAPKGDVPRQTTGLTGLRDAEALREILFAQVEDEKVHGPNISECLAKYLASPDHELGSKTSGQYGIVFKRLQTF